MTNSATNQPPSDVTQALYDLLQRGVASAQAAQRRTLLTEVREKDPEDWNDREWDFANERGLIPPERQGEYEMRLLEKRQAAERAALAGWQGGNLPDTGTATLGVASGQIPAVPQRPVSATLVQEVDGPEDTPDEPEPEPPYSEWDDADLEEELKVRELDVPPKNMAKGKRHDTMVATLEKDDEAAVTGNE